MAEPTNAAAPPTVLAWDIDDVLLGWRSGFHAWMCHQGQIPVLKAEDSVRAGFSDCWPELGDAGVLAQVRIFNSSPHFAHLAELPGARAAIAASRRVIRAGGGNPHLVAVSAAGTEPACKAMREAQIHALGFDLAIVLPLGSSKAQTLARLGARAIIDDSPRVLFEAHRDGLPAIARATPYNTEAPARARFSDWTSQIDAFETALALILTAPLG